MLPQLSLFRPFSLITELVAPKWRGASLWRAVVILAERCAAATRCLLIFYFLLFEFIRWVCCFLRDLHSRFFSQLLDKVPFCFNFLDDNLSYGFRSANSVHEIVPWTSCTRATWSQFQGHQKQMWRFCLLALTLTVAWTQPFGVWGEGSVTVVGDRGIAVAMKQHDMEPGLVLGPCHANAIRKRSLLRARRRAHRFGYTWYRGQLLTASAAGSTPVATPTKTSTSKNVAPPPYVLRKRLTMMSWNAGSLAPALWDMLQQWLDENDIDVLMIQETHWPFTREWATDRYHCLHSGLSGRQAGLLCLVSKRLCSSDDLSWQELIPGRLVHLRLHGKYRDLDILHCYQHVHSSDRLEVRQRFWDSLNDQLTSLPKRNLLYLTGDFNTSLAHRSGAVGLGTFLHQGARCSGTVHTDSEIFHQLLRQHGLQALNTWSSHLGPTFQNSEVVSRLDYLCCRRWHADCTARNVQYLTDFPLLTPTGAQHVPLLTSTLRFWTPNSMSKPTGWSRKQRLILYQQFQDQAQPMIHLHADIHQRLSNLAPEDHSLHTLHHILHSSAHSKPKPPKPERVHDFDITPFQLFKFHGQALRRTDKTSRHSVFQAWFHYTKMIHYRKCMNVVAKTARQAKLQRLFAVADEAERAHDHFRLYQSIRQLAPKQVQGRIQLRNPDGSLASPTQAADLLQQWFATLYQDNDTTSSPVSESVDLWPFSTQDFALGLQRLPLMKALDPAYVPAPIWHLTSQEIAHYLQPCFEQWTHDGAYPQEWSQGHLVFLQKPGKSGQKPGDLRPISLLEPTGKTVLGLVAHRLMTDTFWLLRTLPLFAYLPQRGCQDALTRVFQHCRHVRSELDSVKHRLHHLATGAKMPALFGGLMLSLDLSRAFDEVNRAQLFAALTEIGVSTDLVNLLKRIYQFTSFSFLHKGEFRSFSTQKGIRQGCKAAPILWCIFTADLLVKLADCTSWTFLEHCLTVFADDFCQHSVFDSLAAFETALKNAGKLMDCIADSGLLLNTDKTVALCRFVGTQSIKLTKRHIVRTSTGTFLKIPRRNGQFTQIKMVAEYTYLGVKISYGNFERLTLQHRLKAGDRTQISLHKWLHLRCGLSFKQRLRIWRQCVFASMTHGLLHTGLHLQDLIQLHRRCMQHVRRIFKEPVFITREPHSDFLDRHGLHAPLALLHHLCCKTLQRETQRLQLLPSDDIICSSPQRNLVAQIEVIQQAIEVCGTRDLFTQDFHQFSTLQCPLCLLFLTQLQR